MAALIGYKGLQVLDPDPIGDAGLAIQNDLKELVDRLSASRYVSGLRLAFSNTVSVSVGPGDALSDEGEMNLSLASPVATTLNANGPSGLDAGTAGANKVYFVHVIGDSSDTAQPTSTLLSVNPRPVLPAGYDRFRRIGCIATDGSGDLLRFHQAWGGLTRRYYYADDGVEVLAAGHATAFTAVDLSALVPATARSVTLRAAFTDNAQTGTASDRAALLRTHGDLNNGSLQSMSNGIGSSQPAISQLSLACSADQRIEYRVSHGAAELKLAVASFDDEL